MDLTAAEIRTPANVIYMSTNEQTSFARFDLYFDKESVRFFIPPLSFPILKHFLPSL